MKSYQEEHNSEKIRVFIAIDFPGKMIVYLKDLQLHLKTYKFKASWPKPSNMHLTLKFLGDISEKKLQDVKQSIHNAVLEFKKENKKLLLSAKGIGVFPSIKKSRIIWAGIQSDMKGQASSLEHIHSLLDENLEKAGFKKDKKKFSPHITLCRLKQPVSGKR
ncbi:MAG: RNA 2',3'-cyclic phosphodiesterase, partial [Desulfobacterales bacterium]|nr:RNA 2',3'-cyclic phosphodiesterase [Desulfobacterales bacterium]